MQNISQNHFRIIAIRPITPPNMDYMGDEEKRQIHSIQKAVYGKKWMYMYDGYVLTDTDMFHADGTNSREYGYYLTIKGKDFQDEMLYSTKDLCVNVSAIVGENGSGKSSTVELMVRLINNLAAALMGEKYRNDVSEHLFYIENVYGCLVFQKENRYFRLCIEGRDVTLREYYLNKDVDCYELEKSTKTLLSSDDKNKQKCPIEKNPLVNINLDKLFYTVIYNYSMYAFNFNDYKEEQTKEERWGEWKKKELTEDKVWLKGLFHKNDGYQTPVVLNPMRDKGLIDIPKENKLTRERLLTMLFYKDKKEGSDKTTYPFRTINQNKEIVGLKMTYYDEPNFDKDKVVDYLNLRADRFKEDFDTVRKNIIDAWCQTAQLTYDESTKDNKLAWDYVVYKTLKISKNYNRYNKINKNLRNDFKEELLRKHLNELYYDGSHVTVKLRRALFFLKTHVFRNKKRDTFWLKDVESWMDEADLKWENAIFKINDKMHLVKEKPDVTGHDELLPPPIYDITLLIVEKDNMDDNGLFNHEKAFPFEGLSSGEKQVVGVVSNFIYHLWNINSVWKYEHEPQTKEEELVKYHYVNVVFDEVELYFHPDLQRRFMKILKDSLHNITLEHIKGLNILIVTHSPFVLSDIPASNVLFLRAKGNEAVTKETFASNIHQMLGSSFFMEYAIGDVARDALQEVYGLYANLEDKNAFTQDRQKWLENEAYYKYVGSIISDDYLRNSYQVMMQELMKSYHPQAAVDAERAALKARLAELEKRSDD